MPYNPPIVMVGSRFDVVVIGAGHAGAEAAWAAANLGACTALVTYSRDAIGRMSCNPAIGGIGKGQIVREVDALGGLMGLVTDEAGIQFRMLNRSKGPAVWAPRAQADSRLYSAVLRRYLENCPNLTILEAGVDEILTEPAPEPQNTPGSSESQRTPTARWQRVVGVVLNDGRRIACDAVVVATGTFLRGLMHTGPTRTPGGRIGEAAADRLSASLQRLGLTLGRLKTGTPPRVARDSVDFSRLREQPGDPDPTPFSFMTPKITQSQVSCWLTATNPQVHDLLRANLHRAPLYTGQIESVGPRYCPSIETKIVRFPEKERHQVFLEPEGRDSDRIYLNGVSTSVPVDVQERMVHLIEGLEHARIVQWGYAVEYDFVPPEQIDATLMAKGIRGLFLAGQINGTSGYEEAAGQGIVAGINAGLLCRGHAPITIRRDQAYIGVMIDDLVTRSVTEPYRMFTSRAEYRMHLRYDNADQRLTPLGRAIGLVSEDRWRKFQEQQARYQTLLGLLSALRVDGRSLVEWLRRPDEDGARFVDVLPELAPFRAARDIWARALVAVKYDGYIKKQEREIARFREMEYMEIPPGLDYETIPHLRSEARERLSTIRPTSIGQASRVSGVQPADISVLMVHLAAISRR